MISMKILVFVHLTSVVADLGNVYCPCAIYVNEQGQQEADCQNQNITKIPDCVPNTTQLLDLGENDLRYTHGQFQKFGNLVVLNMFDNGNFAAHIDSFKFLFSLEVLDLGFTNFTNVNSHTFQHQVNLRRLGLQGSMGQLNVSENLFYNLGKLENLSLGQTTLLVLPNLSFVRLPLLRSLDLSFASALILHNLTFSGLSALTYLNLQDPFDTIKLPCEVFKSLSSLEELYLSGMCGVIHPTFDCTAIDERLEYVPSLKRLYIDKGLISHLRKGFLSLNNLEELYLVNGVVDQTCWIVQLNPEHFENLKHSPLRKLVLHHCNMNGLLAGWYKYLTELKEISLSVSTANYWGFWKYFSSGLENTSMTKVRLSITSNNIYAMPEPFDVDYNFKQSELTSLEVTDGRFYCVDDDVITKLPKTLIYLNMSRNYIIHFGIERLKYLVNLETLDLSNQIDVREYPSANCEYYNTHIYSYQFASKNKNLSSTQCLKKAMFVPKNYLQDNPQNLYNDSNLKCLSLPYRLQTLNLSKSRLLCSMVHAFCDSNNILKFLSASVQGDISCFKTQSFWSVLKNLAKLHELNLNGNYIVDIPQNAFAGLTKLRKLTLVDNKLLQLSFDVKDLISLETLDVSANSIQYASNSFTNQIEDLSWETNLTLYLGFNHLVCSCKQLGFVAWLLVTQSISKKNELNCTFENGTQISIRMISHARHILQYRCTRLDVTIGCTVTFWGLNVLLGCLAYIWYNHQKLRYLVSFGRRTLNPYHPIEDCDIEMEYDVYISYEGDFHVTRDITLRDLVIYTILPGLEQRGVKCMIREELDAGRNLYEVISHAVRRSKKVVAFLTNAYCQDIWNVFEFNQAVMEGIYTNRQVAFPVLFEQLRRENVKEEIGEFLKMEPVHKYSPKLSDRAFIDFLYERIRDTRQFG